MAKKKTGGSRKESAKRAPQPKKQAKKKKQTPPSKQAKAKKKSDDVAASAKNEKPVDEPAKDECVVVGLGASAGGLDAFRRFLKTMPADSGMAFVLLQHLDPDHESMMADLLSRHTEMHVVQAEHDMPVEPNHVYMIPPNKFIKLQNGDLCLDEPVKKRGLRMPIDYFFRSLAEQRRERAIGIVLSGTGSDGTLGLREIKAQGGMVMVQAPKSAEYDGMPRSALSTGRVDFICDIEDMPETLTKYVKHPYVDGGRGDAPTLLESAPDHSRAIISLLRTHTDYDFRCYKKGTLSRRIQRRMGLRHVENIDDYVKLLREDPEEVHLLFKDLLISVTAFFREKESWDVLRKKVIAEQVAAKSDSDPYRVWVAGCATGEEAYGVLMLLHDECARQHKSLDIHIFGTDLDSDAIDFARHACYPNSIAADVSPDRLNAYFNEENDRYRVSKRLREECVFAVQNLIGDPPFSNLDLVTCRNVLIYLESSVQQKMFEMFHFALRDEGYLFLGASESVGKQRDLFETVSGPDRIYQKVATSQRNRLSFPIQPPADHGDSGEEQEIGESKPPRGTVELAKRLLLDKFVPATVLVNRRFEVHYFHGPVRNYLDIPAGEPTTDLFAMCMDGLRSKVRGQLLECMREESAVSTIAPRVKRGDDVVAVRVSVEPVPRRKGAEALFLITFVDEPREPTVRKAVKGKKKADAAGKQSAQKSRAADGESDEESLALVEQLEYELAATREDLQSTIEELETSNEELKASNEEVMSMNEELQSTNEELETSREELQSLNEELSTVNNQLEDKVDELEDTNNDLTNLLTSTEIATIFLDTEFRIRRFTPATIDLLNVIPGDVGRPVSDLAPRFNDPKLYDDARGVLRVLAPIEREVCVSHASDESNGDELSVDTETCPDDVSARPDSDIRWFMRRILPYRTSENKIDGVVITFTDITGVKQASRQVERRERQATVVAELGRAAVGGASLENLFTETITHVAATLDNEYCKVLELLPGGRNLKLVAGVGWQDGLVGHATVDTGIDSQAGYTLQMGGPVIVEDLRSEKRFNGPRLLHDHNVVSGMSVVIGQRDEPWGVLGTHTTRPMNFTTDDANFIQSVANVLSEAIASENYEKRLRRDALRAQLVHEAATMAAETESLDQALKGCLELVCRYTNWPVGHVYRPGGEFDHQLHPSDLWVLPVGDAMAPFRSATRSAVFEQGDRALPMHVAESLKPAWRNEIQDDPHFRRRDVATRLGLKSAFALPIVVGDLLVAVLEFFHTASMEPDDNLLETMVIFGEQVGRVFERKRAADHTQEQERQRRLILDSLPVLIAYCNRDAVYQYCNERYREWFKIPPEQVLGKTVREVIGDGPFAKVEHHIRKVLSGERTTFEKSLEFKHGEPRYVRVEYIPHVNENGDVAGYYAMIEDITESKRTERKLKEWSETLEQRVAERTEVSRARAEQLRNLAVKLTTAEQRERTNLAKKLHDELQQTLAGAKMRIPRDGNDSGEAWKSVSDLIDEAIQTSRSLATELNPPVVRDGSLDDMIRWLARRMDERHGLEVRREIEGDVDRVSDDVRALLFEVVRELLFNVVKHAQVNSALVSIHVDDVSLTTSVVDEGCGFDPIDLDSQSEIGFGLLNATERVKAFGGSLDVNSSPGNGATFTLKLPLRTTSPGEAGKVRVLIADDHKMVREGLVRLFADRDDLVIVGEAENGRQAIERCRELSPDVVVMDVSMPDMNGIEATRVIAGELPKTKIIGLSLHEREDFGESMLKAGASEYLHKDGPTDDLIGAILKNGR